jgi:hypothetical protein
VKRHYGRRVALGNTTVGRPSIHKTTTLLEQIAAPISSLSAVANHMRQRRLGDLARKIGAVGRPVMPASV